MPHDRSPHDCTPHGAAQHDSEQTVQQQARAEICRVGRSLFERGYVHASAGNISVRCAGGIVITPTDACLGFLQADQLAFVDDAGVQHGDPAAPRASKTLALHRRIYAAAPAARCVIHTHSTHLVALTLAGVWSTADVLPPITPYYVMKVGHVPLIPYFRPGDPRAAEAVVAAIQAAAARGQTLCAALLDRLGPNVWHDSPAAAMATLEELEETARLWLMSSPRPAPLDEARLAELRQVFGAPW
jgi:ribulose-5-phosphate 4-epimerase/fuculose-1-phosphate aldolase